MNEEVPPKYFNFKSYICWKFWCNLNLRENIDIKMWYEKHGADLSCIQELVVRSTEYFFYAFDMLVILLSCTTYTCPYRNIDR